MKNKALLFAIIGISAASVIGLLATTVLPMLGLGNIYSPAVGTVNITIVGLLFIVIIVEIVSAIKIDDSTYHTALITVCLFVQYLCSMDSATFFADMGSKIPMTVYGVISELAFVAAAISCCRYIIYLYDLRYNAKLLLMMLLPVVFLFAIYTATLFYGYGYIAHFVIAAFIAVAFCTIIFYAEKNNKIGFTTYFVTATFCFSIGAQNVNTMYFNGLTVAIPGVTLFYAALTFAMYIPVYLMFSIHSDKKAVKSTEYKRQAEIFEAKAMLGQIKPHFIFNSLEAVRSLYHRDIASGDAAMNYLSDFLRGSINSFDTELIPFETEIDIVFNYTEFENLKRKNKIDVMFNIDFIDFCVPPFSIQPFVENAFKYSGVGEIENGNIIISSYKSSESVIVEISDNGKGFDVDEIPESSHGIRNACGRFALTLGAEVKITSLPGKGTNIKIVINLNKENVKNENSRNR